MVNFRPDLKPDKVVKVKTPLKTKHKATGELKMFAEVWNTREHKSEISGRDLSSFEGTSFFLNCFAHLYPKGKHPELRLVEENIMLLHIEEHYILDFGTTKHREMYVKEHPSTDWSIIEQRKEMIKKTLLTLDC